MCFNIASNDESKLEQSEDINYSQSSNSKLSRSVAFCCECMQLRMDYIAYNIVIERYCVAAQLVGYGMS